MGKKLVIVESPAKAHTIEKYLGEDYRVLSSVGHIRDLAKTGPGGLGVDIEHNFEPKYTVITGKKKVITELKKAAANAEEIYLATDPDREGEAISWHLFDVLNLEKAKDKKVYRIVFHEITKNAIVNAIKNPRDINNDLVRSQESRRILDRIIGFKLSKLLQSKIKSKSAGRVQSVALKLIVDREKEVQAFVQEEYYTIDAVFSHKANQFEANLFANNNQNIEIKSEEEANNILNALGNDYLVSHIEKKERLKNPKPPFITSTLQQEASAKLNYNAKKTMGVAQKLYEGIDINNNPVGLITYMRTDSVRYAEEFIKDTHDFIKNNFGNQYVGDDPKFKKNKNAQDAHEAIRPTDISRTPESLKKYLTADAYKLYKLIYARALASLMNPAKVNQTTVIINNNDYSFKANGQEIIFDGYLKVFNEYEDTKNNILPKLTVEEKVDLVSIDKVQHFTQPPSRFNEAKLIKEMEELGIGRPSTYAQTMEVLKERAYVSLQDKKFVPTEQGIITSDKLQEFFNNIINVSYTAQMEENLDSIAQGEKVWYEELYKFYDVFVPLLENANQNMEKIPPKIIDETCPLCAKSLVIRRGRYGEFIGCSGYPDCRYIKKDKANEERVEILDVICPKCNEGHFVERITKKGKLKGKKFYACSNYPKCKFIVVNKPIKENCPNCGNILSTTGEKNICENKECKYSRDLI
ncbi:MAG: topoisomerase [Haloplasmataceae bacterium]|jgi:DNA topoisomerase-1|nr:topoisomerase [Haloplasmataceae bacterium]